MHKKRFLRLVSAVLALCMMAALLPTAAFADAATSNEFLYQTLKYTVNADGTTVSVAAQGENAVSGGVVIPETVEHDGKTYAVTSIGAYAFSWCISLTSVTIPSSVTSIGAYAFGVCSALENVTFADNSQLTSIGAYAFSWCPLKSVTIPSSVTSIGNGAFYGCDHLTSVEIPSSVTSIGDNAFYECSALESVTFADNSQLASIGASAFRSTKLKSIVIPEGVTTIGEKAFMDCNSLQTVTIPASVTSVGSDILANTAPKIIYGGTEEDWKNIEARFPKDSKVQCMRHTVKFNANGHGTAPKNVYVENGKTIDCPTLSETGYNLDGWYYTEEGVEKEFVFGDNGTPVTSSMTLKAKWSPISYQLTVGGSAEGHDYDEEVTVDEPTKEGYTFAGWTVETKNVTPQKGGDGKWSFKMPAGNVTLTAKWEINRYTVKFMNGEDEVKSITADYNSTIAVNDAPVAPVKEGFVFGGWYSGSEKFVFGETKVTSDLTLTAKWTKPIFYDITVKNGTTNVASAKKGDLIKLFADEAPEGEAFDYWKVNGAKIEGDSFEMPAENVTAEAVYKAKTYTVVFVTAHDNTPNALTVKHGETISGDRVLKADGYEFGGWYNGKEKFVFGENGTKVTGNLTLTAQWTEVKKPEPKPEPKPDPEPVVYEIVVDNGTAYLDDGATAIHTAEEGQTVILKVNPEALTEGFAFDAWEVVSGEVKLADATASETSFEMPASDVELKATVKPIEPAAEPLTGLEQAALLTTGTVVAGAGVAAVGFAAYGIGVELYAQALLPAGAALPTNCGELAVLVWNMAGKPQPALPAEGLTDAQTALLWAAESGLLPAQAGTTPEDPELPVSAREVVRALRKARSLAPKQ